MRYLAIAGSSFVGSTSKALGLSGVKGPLAPSSGRRVIDPCQSFARAFVVLEAEAKIADRQWPTIPKRVNPHHITSALGGLVVGGAARIDGRAHAGWARD